jgi:hypothetical protein
MIDRGVVKMATPEEDKKFKAFKSKFAWRTNTEFKGIIDSKGIEQITKIIKFKAHVVIAKSMEYIIQKTIHLLLHCVQYTSYYKLQLS